MADHQPAYMQKYNAPQVLSHSRCHRIQLLKNGRFPDADKDFVRLTSREVSSILGADSVDSNLSGDFTADEISPVTAPAPLCS
ncbi:hypothetical protein KUCAC02_018386 [Chaenocephalus aceratus]|uniref:Uncharacterized protein n=1 Tax=Chaenocephalus aceratus TaxID=36190 RepID=A0ACB9W9N1_CHAAC|nr:hypothetical protein KUCAC02_018386 [Chaenocephalus aceratus]